MYLENIRIQFQFSLFVEKSIRYAKIILSQKVCFETAITAGKNENGFLCL